MQMLGLGEALNHLSLENIMHWCDHMLMREDGHVLLMEAGQVLVREAGHVLVREDGHVSRRALEFQNKGQKKKII